MLGVGPWYVGGFAAAGARATWVAAERKGGVLGLQ